MLIGIISDAHGNIFGLQRCVQMLERKGAAKLYFLGDAVNYFSRSAEVLDFLHEKGITCAKGNHEEMLLNDKELPARLAEAYNVQGTRERLQPGHYKFVADWGKALELSIQGTRILMVHGSPFDPLEEYVYPDSDLTPFMNLDYDVVFTGHSHLPFLRTVGDKIVVNVGSVGFLRCDGRYLSCAAYDTNRRKAELITEPFPSDHLDDLKPFPSEIYRVLKRREHSRCKVG